MIYEQSYGIIPLRKQAKQWQCLLVKHGKGHWAFPKGHKDAEETPQETAIRELKEEVGLSIDEFLATEPLTEEYFFTAKGEKVHKKVLYFPALVKGRVHCQKEEIDDAKWLRFEEAEKLATFPATKKVCQTLLNFFSSATYSHKDHRNLHEQD